MPELDELLRSAAPTPTRDPNFEAIGRRADTRTRTRRIAAGGLGIVVALLVAFGASQSLDGSGETGGLETVDDPPVADPLEGVPEDSWVRLLARVPYSAEGTETLMTMTDVARAREQLGVSPLPDGASQEEFALHTEELFGIDEYLWLYDEPTSDDLERELGFRPEQIDRMVRGGSQPPAEIWISEGRFEPAVIAERVSTDPIRSDELETGEYGGIPYYRWGEDYRVMSSDASIDATAVRPLGRGGRLAVGDEWVSWTYGDNEMTGTIDAFNDATLSMAAVDWMRAVGLAADEAGATTLSLSPYFGQSPGSFEEFGVEVSPDLPVLDRPLGFGLGQRYFGDNRWSTVVVLAYATDSEATRNRSDLETSLAMLYPYLEPTVAQDGALLVVTAEVTSSDDLAWWLIPRSPESTARVLFEPEAVGGADRPDLPADIPTQDEVLEDGVVTYDEYSVAFWSYVNCAEDAGVRFGPITLEGNGQFSYGFGDADLEANDDCYWEFFGEVDRTWQVADDD